MSSDLDAINQARATTQQVYERHAQQWHNERANHLNETIWLNPLLDGLPRAARVLYLGCGTGKPNARNVLDRGLQLVGVDYAPAMIAIAQASYPNAHWQVSDMRKLPELGQFHSIFSWDGFFHLSVEDQRQTLPRLAAMMEEDGRLLLTIGTGEGEVTGQVCGERVYHASLEPQEYRQILTDLGFATVEICLEDARCAGRSIVFAQGFRRHTSAC